MTDAKQMTAKEAVEIFEGAIEYVEKAPEWGKGNWSWGRAALAVLSALAERHDKTERQLSHLGNELGNTKERCRKLQAENAALKATLSAELDRSASYAEECRKMKAELERVRPLLEAVDIVGTYGDEIEKPFVIMAGPNKLRGELVYLERKEKEGK